MARIRAEDWITDDGLLRIKGWARDGLTDAQIAVNIGVSYTTFKGWMKNYPPILTALKEGKAPVDTEAEDALIKLAMGHTVTVRKPIKLKEVQEGKIKGQEGRGRIEKERIEYADEEVYVPPNATALIFWLKNRKPELWRDKRESVGGGGFDKPDAYDALSKSLRELAEGLKSDKP